MFESEVYQGFEKLTGQLPAEVVAEFKRTTSLILYQSVLHWSEHCTECAMPECFKTCELYSPRVDGKCQRFIHGMQRLSDSPFDPNFVLRVQFKRWGVLQTQGNASVYPIEEVLRREEQDLRRTDLIRFVFPRIAKKYLVKYFHREKKQDRIREQNTGKAIPDAFLVESFNPNTKTVNVSLTMRSKVGKFAKLPFQHKIELTPGYHRHFVPFDEISKRMETELPFRIDLLPYDLEPEEPLYFGRLDFVKVAEELIEKRKPKGEVKCVVWDLDNTLWDGVLVETKPESIQLKPGIKDIIVDLDRKGVLHSVASKNDLDHAMKAIQHLGLDEFFLYPEISWGPKSHGIKRIARNLNIDTNTFLFVDDNAFEREEVSSSLPEVLCLDAANYQTIPSMKEFDLPVTEESKARRNYYLTEENRKNIAATFDDNYFDFLRSCELQIEIRPLDQSSRKRVYELAQRTNQMNFSGNRYTENQIEQIEDNKGLDTFVVSSHDRFGDYGIVGFGIVDRQDNKLIDLMFSCRIQSKRVEHAFFNYLLGRYLPQGDFYVNYRRTERNKFTGQVFEDLSFEEVDRNGDVLTLVFRQSQEILDDQILKVTEGS